MYINIGSGTRSSGPGHVSTEEVGREVQGRNTKEVQTSDLSRPLERFPVKDHPGFERYRILSP